MKSLHSLVATVIGTAAPMLAADPVNHQQLKSLITDNTLYVSMPVGAPGAPEGGIAPIYFAQGGTATARLPTGTLLTGNWSFVDQGYCVDWNNGPKNSCSRLLRGTDSFAITDTKTGEIRGHVYTITTGNTENL